MESRGKSVEREGKEEQEEGLMVKKLRQGGGGGGVFGKKAGPSTPPPTWRLQLSSPPQSHTDAVQRPEHFLTTHPTRSSSLSARELCATLWEIEHHHIFSPPKMSRNNTRHGRRYHNDRDLEFVPPQDDHPPDQLAQTGGLIAASLAPQQKYARTDHVLKSVTPETCSSLMEVAPYKAPPIGSMDLKGRIGAESSSTLKTSTELLKVLNRIWTLEEQHVTSKLALRALKQELNQSQKRVKELMQERQKDKQIVNDLMKRVGEDKYSRKQRQLERVEAHAQVLRKEIEEERKLRKRSESLHRKLAIELAEMKSAYSADLKELEREKKARILLENLCDEFAKGIRDYEQVVRSLKQKPVKESVGRESLDRLILHISEAWLDERMQTKFSESDNELAPKDTVVDKLTSDIEGFLQTKRGSKENGDLSLDESNQICFRRHSLESFVLNEAGSAPQIAEDDDHSSDSEPVCFELCKKGNAKENKDGSKKTGANTLLGHLEETSKSSAMEKKASLHETTPPSGLPTLPEEFNNDRTTENIMIGEQSLLQKIRPNAREGQCQEVGKPVGIHRSSSKDAFGHTVRRSHSLRVKGDRTRTVCKCQDDCCILSGYAGHASPVQKWPLKMPLPDSGKSSSLSLKWPRELKESTLMAKLLEARIEGQQSRSRAHRGSV